MGLLLMQRLLADAGGAGDGKVSVPVAQVYATNRCRAGMARTRQRATYPDAARLAESIRPVPRSGAPLLLGVLRPGASAALPDDGKGRQVAADTSGRVTGLPAGAGTDSRCGRSSLTVADAMLRHPH